MVMNPRTPRIPARRLSALVLLVAVAALPACRSDGGFGRKGNARSFLWSMEQFTDQMQRDWATTTDSVVGLPSVVSRDFRQGVDGLSSTYWLYVEGTTHGTVNRIQHTPKTHGFPTGPGADADLHGDPHDARDDDVKEHVDLDTRVK